MISAKTPESVLPASDGSPSDQRAPTLTNRSQVETINTNKALARISSWDVTLLERYLPMDFGFVGEPWDPLVLTETGQKDVSIEATEDNFQVLLDQYDAWSKEGADGGSPPRQLKRCKSDGKKPRGSPRGKVYHIASKGHVRLQELASETTPLAARQSVMAAVAEQRGMPTSSRPHRKPRRFCKRVVSDPSAAEVLGSDVNSDIHSFTDEFSG